MKLNYKNVLKLFAAGIFLLALAININVSVNKPFATLSDLVLKANAQGETNTSSSCSCSSSANYVYGEKLVATELHDEIVTLNCGIEILYSKLPFGFTAYHSKRSGIIGEKKNCQSFALARCDQNKVGVFLLPVATANQFCN